MDVTLMHMDLPVLTAAYDSQAHAFTGVLGEVNREHAPAATFDAYGHTTLKLLNQWWEGRAIPRTRDGVSRLKRELGIASTVELLEISHGLSLSDTYWLRGGRETASWHDLNFFENAFDEELNLVTLGDSSAWKRSMPKGSPSASVSGDLKKAWIIDADGQRVLLKAGRGLTAQEVFNEVCATRLYAEVMPGSDFVPYALMARGGRLYSVCPNMLGGSQDLVSAADLMFERKRRGSESTYEWCVSALELACPKDDVELKLDRMLACDFVLGNFDRHYSNFGLIRDARSLEFVSLAPIYDSGNSLWCDKMLLDSPIDYAYEALPFAYRGRPDGIADPTRQVRMLRDWRWYQGGMFDEAPDIVYQTLSEDENLPPARIDKVVRQVKANVALVERESLHPVWRGTCLDRMRAAGKTVDPLPCMAR